MCRSSSSFLKERLGRQNRKVPEADLFRDYRSPVRHRNGCYCGMASRVTSLDVCPLILTM